MHGAKAMLAASIAWATGCGEPSVAGPWSGRTVAFAGIEDREGQVAFVSAAATGSAWPRVAPEGVPVREFRWAEQGRVLVSRTDERLYGFWVSDDERRDLGAVPTGEASLLAASLDQTHIALAVYDLAALPRDRVMIVAIATGEPAGSAAGCVVEPFVWGARPGEAFAVEHRCAPPSLTVQERAVVRILDGASTDLFSREPGVAIDLAPAPDGLRLAIVASDGVHMVDLATGEATTIEVDPHMREEPSWSSDAQWIAWIDRTDDTVVRMRADGTQRGTAARVAGWATHAPGGDTLWWERPCGDGSELVAWPTDGSEPDVVVACASFGDPAFAPDGETIAVGSRCDPDTTRFRFYSNEGRLIGTSACETFDPEIAWSPDGDAILTTIQSEEAPLDVAIVRRDGATRRIGNGRDAQWRPGPR